MPSGFKAAGIFIDSLRLALGMCFIRLNLNGIVDTPVDVLAERYSPTSESKEILSYMALFDDSLY